MIVLSITSVSMNRNNGFIYHKVMVLPVNSVSLSSNDYVIHY